MIVASGLLCWEIYRHRHSHSKKFTLPTFKKREGGRGCLWKYIDFLLLSKHFITCPEPDGTGSDFAEHFNAIL